jgi:pimeloyl-ACP methyl ester carboxylesterase
VFALVWLAGGCSSETPAGGTTPTSEPAQATPTTVPTATPVPTPTAWPAPAFVVGTCPFALPSGVEEKCGTVAVPQDRSSDGSATFELEVVVFASEADAPAPDPLVYLAGGPGENAIDTLRFTFDDLFRPFLKARDVVVFDQRGAGYSEPGAECEELAALEIDLLDRSLSIDEESALGVAAAQACYDRLMSAGVALDALSTAESAADVHSIMTALGYDEWDSLGISYGTRLAQTIMRDRPEGVRSVIRDSVVPLEADIIAQTPGSFARRAPVAVRRVRGERDVWGGLSGLGSDAQERGRAIKRPPYPRSRDRPADAGGICVGVRWS